MKDRLKKLRKALNLTQQKFADKLGVKQNTIAQYEMGRNDPSDAVIISICREFGASEEWLRNGTGDMFVPMSLDEEIASFIGDIQSDIEENFKKRFISALSKLDEDEWIFIEKFMESVLEGRKK
jgi:bacteriophage CI repressor helix-turn-helix domain